MASSRRLTLRLVCVAALLSGCIVPTDKSDQLTIQFAAIPSELLKGDSVPLEASLVDQDGVAVPNAEIEITADPDLVARVLEGGVLLALDTGTATVTARAIQYEETPDVPQTITVRGLLEVDSIRPTRPLLYGELLRIYGIGLNPASLFGVAIGGETGGEVLNVAGYVPDVEDQPNRFGTLLLWIAPPATTSDGVAIVTAQGGLVLNDRISIVPRDFLEPNDTIPSGLGTLSEAFGNPALAFETRFRGDERVPVDWYTFTTSAAGDWTIEVDAPDLGRPVGVFVADSLAWDNFLWPNLAIFTAEGQGWMVGAGANICRGLLPDFSSFVPDLYLSPLQLNSRFRIMPLRDLPAGTHHVLVTYLGQPFTFYDPLFVTTAELDVIVEPDSGDVLRNPAVSQVAIVPRYESLLSPDQAEENDWCNVAAPLTLPGSGDLSFDVPFDVDWFSFTVAPDTQMIRFTAIAGDSISDPDIYVIEDQTTSLLVRDFALEVGPEDSTFGAALPPGDYFLVVADFVGVASTYSLTGTVLPSPPAQPAVARSVAAERVTRKIDAVRRSPRPLQQLRRR